MLEIAAGIVVTGLAILLLARGWRGRRVGVTPFCRRCGFNLTGLPSDSYRCAECGRDLREHRAIVAGTRERRPFPLILGGLLLIVGVAMTFGNVRRRISEVPWIQHYPVSWVLRDAAQADPARRTAALAELQRRVMLPKLSKSESDAILAGMLDLHADRNQPWDRASSQVFEQLDKAQLLSDDARRRLLQQGLTMRIDVRPRLRADSYVLVRAVLQTDRLPPVLLMRTFDIDALRLSDHPDTPAPAPPRVLVWGLPNPCIKGSDASLGAFSVAPTARLGAHELQVSTKVRPWNTGNDAPMDVTLEAIVPVTIVGHDESTYSMASDEPAKSDNADALKEVEIVRDDQRLLVWSEVKWPRNAWAMQVLVRPANADEKAWRAVGNLFVEAGSRDCQGIDVPLDPSWVQGPLDVLYRPSLDVADRAWQPSEPLLGVEILRANVTPRPPTREKEFLIDESLRPAMEQSLTFSMDASNLIIACANPPATIHHQVFVRAGEREVPLGMLRVLQMRGARGHIQTMLPLQGAADVMLSRQSVEIILRPVAERERRRPDASLPWAGEIRATVPTGLPVP